MTSSLLIEEVKKKIDNKHLMEIFDDYLSKVDCNLITFEKCIKEDKDLMKYSCILKESHCIFVSSQKMLDDLACKDILPYENRDLDIVMCYTLYSGVCVVLKNNLPSHLYNRIQDIYEEANLGMNVPRDDSEENAEFFSKLRAYYCDFYIPLRLINKEVSISEYEFISGKCDLDGIEKEIYEMCSH